MRGGMIDHADLHGGGAVVVGHALGLEQLPDPARLHAPQADMGAAHRGDAPGEAPAIAVKHGQRPEIARVEAHAGLEHLAHRVHPGAAVAVHHALRAPGGPGRVVDGDGLFLVLQPALHGRGGAGGEEVLVGIARRAGVVHPHHAQPGEVQRLHHRFELGVHEEELRAGVLEDVADLVGGQADIDGDQDAAGRGHAVVRLQHGRDIRAEKGHAIVLGQARRAERRGETMHALLVLAVGVAPSAVDDGDLVREDISAPLEEAQRGELGAIDVLALHVEASAIRDAMSGQSPTKSTDGGRPLPAPWRERGTVRG